MKKLIIALTLVSCSFSSIASDSTFPYLRAKEDIKNYVLVAFPDKGPIDTAYSLLNMIDNEIGKQLANNQDCRYTKDTVVPTVSYITRKKDSNKVIENLHNKMMKSVSDYVTIKCKELTE